MVCVNEVYLNINNDEYIRIIDIDSGMDTLYLVICLKMYVFPKPYKLSVFREEVENKFYLKVPDMFLNNINECDLSKRDIDRRNYLWDIINKYWTENRVELLLDTKRSRLFKLISEEHEMSLSTVKRIFTKFFERGMCKNSLLAKYSNCGAKGKERKLGLVKTGRPKKYDTDSIGINITEEIKEIFRTYIDKYYYKSNWTITEVYRQILDDCFSYKHYENGELKLDLFSNEAYPKYSQFNYYFNKIKDEKKSIIERCLC